MKAYIEILMQPLHERRNGGPLWMTWLLIALLIVAGIAVQLATGNIEMAGFAMSIPLGGLLILWWILFVKNALQQNAPTLALLVPAMRGRLMRLTTILWLAASLFGGCVAALVFGHFGWGLLATAAFLLLLAVGRRYFAVAASPGTVMIIANVIPHPSIRWLPLLARTAEPAVASAGFLLLAAIGAACLPLVFQRGGDRHWRWQARYAFRQDAIRTGGLSTASGSMWCGWGQILRVAYLASLKRDCAAVTTPAPARMQMYALGPDGHWMIYAGTPALMLVFAALGGWLLEPSAFVTSFAPVYVTFVVMIPLGVFVHNVNVAIYRSATEQGLLRLTPRVVPAAEFNRRFAGRLLGDFFKLWLVCAFCSLAGGRAVGGAAVDWSLLLSLTALQLPFATLLLRDYAAMREPYGSSATALMAATVLIVLGTMSSMKFLLTWDIWPLIGVASVLITALLLSRGWRRMMALPPAFPARRMA